MLGLGKIAGSLTSMSSKAAKVAPAVKMAGSAKYMTGASSRFYVPENLSKMPGLRKAMNSKVGVRAALFNRGSLGFKAEKYMGDKLQKILGQDWGPLLDPNEYKQLHPEKAKGIDAGLNMVGLGQNRGRKRKPGLLDLLNSSSQQTQSAHERVEQNKISGTERSQSTQRAISAQNVAQTSATMSGKKLDMIAQYLTSIDQKTEITNGLLKDVSASIEQVRKKLYDENTIAVKFSKSSDSGKNLSDVSENIEKIKGILEEDKEDSGILSGLSGLAGSLGGSGMGRGLVKSATRVAGRGALSVAGGYGIDAIAGGFGVGKDKNGNDLQIDEAQDEKNWNEASLSERLQSGAARGIEHVGDFFGLTNMSRQARAARVKNETEYLNQKRAQAQAVANSMAPEASVAATQRLGAAKGYSQNEINQRNQEEKTRQQIYGATGEMPDTSLSGIDGKPINEKVQQNMSLVENALKEQGITDPKYVAAIKGNIMKESGGQAISERMNYGGSSNDRIRSIFGSRASNYTDEELNAIKGDPEKMGELMYGSGTDLGRKMGNTEAGEGYKFRGRGFIQLTGKKNYSDASQAIFGDDRLVQNPDLLNDPETAAKASAWYMKSGQQGMAKQMGMDVSNLSQEQANLLATSQIAGRAIKPGEGYLGKENLEKVTQHAAVFARASQTSAQQAPTQTAQMMFTPGAENYGRATLNPQGRPSAQPQPNGPPTTGPYMMQQPGTLPPNFDLNKMPPTGLPVPEPMQRKTGEAIDTMGSQLASAKEESQGGGSPTIINNNNGGGGGGAQMPPPSITTVSTLRNDENSMIRVQNMMSAYAVT